MDYTLLSHGLLSLPFRWIALCSRMDFLLFSHGLVSLPFRWIIRCSHMDYSRFLSDGLLAGVQIGHTLLSHGQIAALTWTTLAAFQMDYLLLLRWIACCSHMDKSLISHGLALPFIWIKRCSHMYCSGCLLDGSYAAVTLTTRCSHMDYSRCPSDGLYAAITWTNC